MSDDHIVKAIAVSRPPCPDCSVALAEYGKDHGRVLVQVVPPPTEEEQRQRQAAKTAVQAAADRVVSQVDSYERDHQSQWDLIYDPSVTGFAGYWTNHLFNQDTPRFRSGPMHARRHWRLDACWHRATSGAPSLSSYEPAPNSPMRSGATGGERTASTPQAPRPRWWSRAWLC